MSSTNVHQGMTFMNLFCKDLYKFRFTLLIHSFFVNTHSRLIWQWCYLNFELKNCKMIWAVRVRNTLNAASVLGISLQETKSFISSAYLSWNFKLELQAGILWIFSRLIFISPPFHFSRTIHIHSMATVNLKKS